MIGIGYGYFLGMLLKLEAETSNAVTDNGEIVTDNGEIVTDT
jgi:hypothetical protein